MVQTAEPGSGWQFPWILSKDALKLILASFKGMREEEEFEGWNWTSKFLFLMLYPPSFLSFVKVNVELGLKDLFEILWDSGNIHMQVMYTKGFWGWVSSELGTRLCPWASWRQRLMQWLLLEGQGCTSVPTPWAMSSIYHLSNCSQSIITSWMFFYSDYRCSTPFQRSPE